MIDSLVHVRDFLGDLASVECKYHVYDSIQHNKAVIESDISLRENVSRV